MLGYYFQTHTKILHLQENLCTTTFRVQEQKASLFKNTAFSILVPPPIKKKRRNEVEKDTESSS